MASAHVKQLHKKLAELDVQLAELNAKRSIIQEMINEECPPPKKTRAPKSNVKTFVMDALTKVGSRGLNASICVEMADAEGKKIERGSVSSLLSRLKNDGVVSYDEDGKYRLTSTPRQTNPSMPGLPGGTITPIRTSGAS